MDRNELLKVMKEHTQKFEEYEEGLKIAWHSDRKERIKMTAIEFIENEKKDYEELIEKVVHNRKNFLEPEDLTLFVLDFLDEKSYLEQFSDEDVADLVEMVDKECEMISGFTEIFNEMSKICKGANEEYHGSDGTTGYTFYPNRKNFEALEQPETVTEFADRCKECGARYGKLLKEKTAYWIRWYEGVEHDKWDEFIPHCKCSECNKEYDPHLIKSIKYCSNCGRKMVEKAYSKDVINTIINDKKEDTK